MVVTQNCICHQPPHYYGNFLKSFIGTDMTNNRYGEVSIKKCIHCNSNWLHYLYENEFYSNSGRWFTCLIQKNDIAEITPENSIEYINNSEWYIYGGSFFNTNGKIGHRNLGVHLTR